MEIDTFEDIEVNRINEDTTPNQNFAKNSGGFNISPQTIQTIAQTLLPLFNNLSKLGEKQNPKENAVIETQDYSEIKTTKNQMEFPSQNPQFDTSNFLKGENMNKCNKCGGTNSPQLQEFNKKYSKRAIENAMEQHRKMVNHIKNKH